MVIKLILVGIIIYGCFKILNAAIKKISMNAARASQMNANQGSVENLMIQDPVCQVYFTKTNGVRHLMGGKELWFCSEDCRDKYLSIHE